MNNMIAEKDIVTKQYLRSELKREFSAFEKRFEAKMDAKMNARFKEMRKDFSSMLLEHFQKQSEESDRKHAALIENLREERKVMFEGWEVLRD